MAIFCVLFFALPALADSHSVISPQNRRPAPVPRSLDDNSFQGGLDLLQTVADRNKLNTTTTSSKSILQTITQWLLSLVGTIAVMSLLYGGFLYITSQGEDDKVKQAKNIILYSVIGIIIIGVSAIIVNVVINVATQ